MHMKAKLSANFQGKEQLPLKQLVEGSNPSGLTILEIVDAVSLRI